MGYLPTIGLLVGLLSLQGCSLFKTQDTYDCDSRYEACGDDFFTKTGVMTQDRLVNTKNKVRDFLSPENQRRIGQIEQGPAALATNYDPQGTTYYTRVQPQYAPNRQNLGVRGGQDPLSLSTSQKAIKVGESSLINELKASGLSDAALKETIQFSFDQEELGFVVQQILGGVLEVNYLITEPLSGLVTFQTEKPVTKLESINIVRNILGSNGYILRQINGVFQIGTAETINAILTTAAAGQQADAETRVIYLQNGDATQMAEVLTALLPENTTVVPYTANNSLLVRSDPESINDVVILINELLSAGIGNNLVDIVPLSDNSPDVIAAQLNAYFQVNRSTGIGEPFIIPLASQQALMIGVKNQQAMRLIKSLIAKMDQRTHNEISLRVIKLKHRDALDVANQLNDLFDNFQAAPTRSTNGQTAGNQGSNGGSAGQDRNTSAQNNESVRTPALLRNDNNQNNQQADSSLIAQPSFPSSPQPVFDVSLAPDIQNNALLVRSNYKQFVEINDAVALIDTAATQIAIEITIAEVVLNDNLNYGIQWFLSAAGFTARSSNGSTSAVDPGSSGAAALITKTLGNFSISAVLNALQEVTDVNVLSSPYLTVMDNKSGTLSIGDQISFVTRSQSSDADGNTTVTNEVTTKDTGVILVVTPKIRDNNTVILNIDQEISTAKALTTESQINPIISQRKLTSDIIIESGKTVLLGGLIEERDTEMQSGVPILSKIKGVGKLFSQTQSARQRSELLIMITPRIIRQSSELQDITKAIRGRIR